MILIVRRLRICYIIYEASLNRWDTRYCHAYCALFYCTRILNEHRRPLSRVRWRGSTFESHSFLAGLKDVVSRRPNRPRRSRLYRRDRLPRSQHIPEIDAVGKNLSRRRRAKSSVKRVFSQASGQAPPSGGKGFSIIPGLERRTSESEGRGSRGWGWVESVRMVAAVCLT